MKKILFLLVCVALTGCGQADRLSAKFTGKATKICVDGVQYLQFTSGATVQYDQNGKVVPCT